MADARAEPSCGDPTQAPRARRDPKAPRRFVFLDTETTGLDFARHQLTEVAWIVRFEDGREEEHCVVPEHTLDGADPTALELTRYHEQIAPRPRVPAEEWLVRFLEHAQDAVLVGAVPDFDARHLEQAAARIQRTPTWDHHLLDVETFALPLIGEGPQAPRSLARTCRALGIPHDKDQAHGALYDARQAMRVFDRVHELLAELRATGTPLPPAVTGNEALDDIGATRADDPDPTPPHPPGQATSARTS
ncbi:MAG: PolC-type DNA polymerase III [Nitriliruptoraceae bacterium]